MTVFGVSRPQAEPRIGAERLVTLALAATLFISAALLFGIQPMFTKMVLPRLGGSPSVWSVAMVFFQTVLLAGYLYAHLSTRYLRFRMAVAVHLGVLALAFLALPIAVAHGFGRPPAEGEAIWLIGLLAMSVGLPFFAVAGNAPLLQAWFAACGHPKARNPYFLYGASNVGSFASLLAYPLILEPELTLRQQSQLWTWGFGGLTVLIAGCAALMMRAGPGGHDADRALASLSPAPSVRARVEWTLLSFLPSALLIAVTAHIATEVVSAPFLWVVPLALFLATFAIVFREREIIPRAILLKIQPVLAVALALNFVVARWTPISVSLPVHLLTFFVSALLCHGALYIRRPNADHLTGFYLWMSFGGALGGAFAALIAPHVFKSVAEYPILIVATFIARPGLLDAGLETWKREAVPVLALGAALLAPAAVFGGGWEAFAISALLALGGAMIWQSQRPVRLIALAAVMFALTRAYEFGFSHAVYARSFFGVYKVVDFANGHARLLFHGADDLRRGAAADQRRRAGDRTARATDLLLSRRTVRGGDIGGASRPRRTAAARRSRRPRGRSARVQPRTE